jgi:uncharacterized protein YndB with AHSA1/START domain
VNLDLVFEEVLPHPVEAVWGALTDAAAISEWLMATTDFRPQVGAKFRMQTTQLSADGWVDAEVLELDPPRRMVWAWSVNDGLPPTTVTFELATEAGVTRLTLTHVGEIDPVVGGLLRAGWPGRIDLLRRSLD